MVDVFLLRVLSSVSIAWSSSFFSSSALLPTLELPGPVSSKIINQDLEVSSEVQQSLVIGWALLFQCFVLEWECSIWRGDSVYSIIIYENTRHQSQLIPRYFRFSARPKRTSNNCPNKRAIQFMLWFDSSSRVMVRKITGSIIQRWVFLSS